MSGPRRIPRTAPSPLLEAALSYAVRGWPVFPCHIDKTPRTKKGFKDASLLQPVIREWWARWPDASIGCPTGYPTGFDALDIDGEEGRASLAQLEAEHGPLPDGPRQRTGGGGEHRFMASGSLHTSARRLPGLDVRGKGGYVIMAPSGHPSGGVYVAVGFELELPAPPAWLLAALARAHDGGQLLGGGGAVVSFDDAQAETMLRMAGLELREVTEGQRNDALFRAGCALRRYGLDGPTILMVLSTANAHLCRPPLAAGEVRKIAESAARYEPDPAFTRGVQRDAARVDKIAADAKIDGIVEAAVERDDKAELRELVSRAAGVRIERVIQAGRDHPHYYLDLGDGEPILVGPSILQPTPLAEALLRHRQRCGFRIKGKDWERVHRALIVLIEVSDDSELERRGQTLGWLRDVLDETIERRKTCGRTVDIVRLRLSFVEDGWLYLNAGKLLGLLAARNVRITQPELVSRLKEVGASRRPATGIIQASDEKRRAQARYWAIEAAAAASFDDTGRPIKGGAGEKKPKTPL